MKAPLEPELRRCLNEETNTRWSQPYDDLKEGQFRLRQMQMQSPWGSNEFETFKSENRSCLAGVEWVGLSRRVWSWRGSWDVFLMNILAMASNLDLIQSTPGSHWKFLKQEETNYDFCFKWLFWFLPEWNLGCKGSRVKAETLARRLLQGSWQGMMVVRDACLVSRTLFLWDNNLLLGYSVVFLPFQISGAEQDRVNPLPQVCSPVCFLLVLVTTTWAWLCANCSVSSFFGLP